MKNYLSFITKDSALVACSAVLNFFLSSYLMAQTIEEVIVTPQTKAIDISVQDVGLAIIPLDYNKIYRAAW